MKNRRLHRYRVENLVACKHLLYRQDEFREGLDPRIWRSRLQRG